MFVISVEAVVAVVSVFSVVAVVSVVKRTDLNLGEVSYFFPIITQFLNLFHEMVLDFYFLLCDSENDFYNPGDIPDTYFRRRRQFVIDSAYKWFVGKIFTKS